MNRLAKTLAASASVVATLALVASAQTAPRRPQQSAAGAANGTITVTGALEWLEVAQISALQEGNVKWLSPWVGTRVTEGEEIGQLHDDVARLNAEKAALVAKSEGAKLKAEAQYQQAKLKLARDLRAIDISRGAVSDEEIDKDKAELNFADAQKTEAKEKQQIDVKDAELAATILKQHTIVAPFTGYVLDRMKNPGESVKSHEPLLRIGKTDRFKFVGWVPLAVSQRIRVGDAVQFRPVVNEADLGIEGLVFEGKITAVIKESSTFDNDSRVSILAEINNPTNEAQPELELIQGMQGEIRILQPGTASPATATRTVDATPAPAARSR